MHPRYVQVDSEHLKRLYEDERLTTTEIAVRLGCGPTMIRRRLKRFDIASRRRGTDPERWQWLHPGRETGQTWSPALAYAVGLTDRTAGISR